MASALVLVTSSTRKRPRGPSGQQSRRVSRRRAPSARSSRARRLARTPHTQEAPPDSPAGHRAALTFRLCVCSGKGKEKRQVRKCGRCSHLAPATSRPGQASLRCQSREGGGVGAFLHLPLGRRHSDRDTLSSEFKSVPESS